MSILNLISEYQHRKISRRELDRTLNQYLQLCERKQKELARLEIPEADLQRWENELKPAVENCYAALSGAAKVAMKYTKRSSESLIPKMISCVQEVERILTFVDNRNHFISGKTRDVVQRALDFESDGLGYSLAQVRSFEYMTLSA